jgi:serine/threonine protein phosphatase PrpC
MGVMAGDAGWVEGFLEASRLAVPDELPLLVDRCAKSLGAQAATVFLADLDQQVLVPLPLEGGPAVYEAVIDTTVAGRAYRFTGVVESAPAGGDRTVWVPLVDGAERLGVLQVVLPEGERSDRRELGALGGLVAELIITKGAYGDFFEVARRRRPMTVAAELLWQLLPPLTFATNDLVITAMFVPTHDLGGDAFDYGVGYQRADVAVFDGMGHGLDAGLLATVAVAGNRNARRRGRSLAETAHDVGDNVERHAADRQFVTGALTSLHRETGRFSWCVAGHPPPLLLRAGRAVKSLDSGVGMPFGVGPASEVFHEQLEPGDRVLLYTDGVTDARTAAGEFFQLERLVDLVGRIGGADPPAETMRRLMHAIQDHNHGPLRDDATVVMIEWRGQGSRQVVF